MILIYPLMQKYTCDTCISAQKHVGRNSHAVASLPPLDPQGQFLFIPVMVLATRFVKRNNAAVG